MSLAEDEAVAIGQARCRGIEPHHIEVQHGENVGGRQIASGMAEPGAMDHLEARAADVGGGPPERGHGIVGAAIFRER